MAENLAPSAKLRFWDNSGNILSGGLLFTYAAGTTTKLATYTDSTGGTPNTNPVVLDSTGQCNCWIPPGVAYKFVLSPSTDTDPPTNPFWTVDNITAGISSFAYGADAGTVNAYVVTAVTGVTSNNAGVSVLVKILHTTTGVSTLNVNSQGSQAVVDLYGNAIPAGALQAGQMALFVSTGSAWQLVNPASVSTGIANVLAYGADATGAADSTTAIQNAINTGMNVYFPPGTYKVTNALTTLVTSTSQTIYGAGRTNSVIKVDAASFNMSALGVFSVIANSSISGQQGQAPAIFRDLGVAFVQPDTSTRGSLNQYPPAIYVNAAPRIQVSDLRFTAGWNGIYFVGNCGGWTINNLESSCFNYNVYISGDVDTDLIDGLRCWPFGLTANQTSVFSGGACVGIYVTQCDGLLLHNSMFICGLGMYIPGYAPDPPSIYITSTGFDTYSGIQINMGTLEATNCYFSLVPTSNVQALYASGNTVVNLTNCLVLTGPTSTTYPAIDIASGAGNATDVTLANCTFDMGITDSNVVRAQIGSGGASSLIMTGNFFNHSAGVSTVNPVVHVYGGPRISFVGNRITDRGSVSPSGVFLQIDQDDYHIITSNVGPGWTWSHPSLSTTVSGLNSPSF